MKRVFQIFAFSLCFLVTGATSGMAADNHWQKQDKPPERPKEREKPKEDKRPDPPKPDKKKPEGF